MDVRLPLPGLSKQRPQQRSPQSGRWSFRSINAVRLSCHRTKMWLTPAATTGNPKRNHEPSISLRIKKFNQLMMKLELKLNYIRDHWSLLVLMDFCLATLKRSCQMYKHWMPGIKRIKEMMYHSQMTSVKITQFRSDLHRSTFTYHAQKRDL